MPSDRRCSWHDIILALLSLAVTGGFFGCLAALMWWTIPEGNREVMLTMTGVLGTAWVGVIGYFFGSSAGSAQKDATISALSKPNGTPVAPPRDPATGN